MSDAEDVVGSKRRNIYTPNYFQLSEDDETAKALAVEHVDLFLEEKERREHFLQPLSHAYPSNKDVCIDEYTWDSSWRDRVSVHCFERKKVHLVFLFIFLPCKEKYDHASSGSNSTWSYLSLKTIGWGPPGSRPEEVVLVVFVFVFVFVSYVLVGHCFPFGLGVWLACWTNNVRVGYACINSHSPVIVKGRLFLYEIDTMCFSG